MHMNWDTWDRGPWVPPGKKAWLALRGCCPSKGPLHAPASRTTQTSAAALFCWEIRNTKNINHDQIDKCN